MNLSVTYYLPSQLSYYLELIYTLTQKEIKVRYKNTVMGYLWSVGNPMAFALIYFFVFKTVMRFPIDNYTLFLIAGLFPWQAFSNSVMGATTIFINNASLIKKVIFPRYCLVIAILLNDSFHFIMSIPVVIFFLWFYRMLQIDLLLWLIYIPLNLFAQLLFTFGLAMIVASVNLFFRDMERLMGIFLNLWFFLTPILYSTAMIPKEYLSLFYFNPQTLIIDNWRNVWMYYSFDWTSWAISLGLGTVVSILGILVYRKLNCRFSEVV